MFTASWYSSEFYHPQIMNKPISKVQEGLIQALLNIDRSPDVTKAEAVWLRRLILRRIAEFSVIKEQQEKPE